jgi:hypothetical protein
MAHAQGKCEFSARTLIVYVKSPITDSLAVSASVD